MAVFQVGLVLYKSYFGWLNFGSSVIVLLIRMVGFFIRIYFQFTLVVYRYLNKFVCYIVYMFNLKLLTIRFKNLLVSGRYYYDVVEKGVFLFRFIKNMDRMFKIGIKKVLRKKFFLK